MLNSNDFDLIVYVDKCIAIESDLFLLSDVDKVQAIAFIKKVCSVPQPSFTLLILGLIRVLV